MPKETDEQIKQWLKKLEQESWQLELLVSAFTIFLLIQAIDAYSGFLQSIYYEYNLSDRLLSLIYIFLSLLGLSIRVLTIFLIIHLLLRGFWIGTIGLRSVQSTIEFSKLNYSPYFTDKIKKRVISLDNMVILLDEICSLIFSIAFLLMSVIIAFGLYVLFLGICGFAFGTFISLFSDSISTIALAVGVILFFTVIITGLIYFIDYITLGFFKKFQWFSRIYYPFYRFYGIITLAVISRSIYYYLISRFSKKKIRIGYLMIGVIVFTTSIINFDQYQFYPEESDKDEVLINYYDNLRPAEKYIEKASIQGNVISGPFVQLFLRYDPKDNSIIQTNCPDFAPLKEDGFNWRFKIESSNMSFFISRQDYADEDREKLLDCLSATYQITVNDSVYQSPSLYFFKHPSKHQKGLMTMISTEGLNKGENLIKIKKISVYAEGGPKEEEYVRMPFWLE